MKFMLLQCPFLRALPYNCFVLKPSVLGKYDERFGSEIITMFAFFLSEIALMFLCLKSLLPLLLAPYPKQEEITLNDFKSQHFHKSQGILLISISIHR